MVSDFGLAFGVVWRNSRLCGLLLGLWFWFGGFDGC